MVAPVLMKPIPAQVINEGAAYGPFNLKDYIQVAEGSAPARFRGELASGAALPVGMICTEDGMLTGIPAKNTQGNYEVIITAKNPDGSMQATLMMTIKPSLIARGANYFDELK